MASTLEFTEYICDQISGAGIISYKKMFGEYCIYCNAKPIGLVCDDQFFLKITKKVKELSPELEELPAYKGAKLSFLIENLDDQEAISELVLLTYQELPAPKLKKKKVVTV